MAISERINFDIYYRDKRFERKKPVIGSIGTQKVGDNMYFKDKNGNWRQHPTDYHNKAHERDKDLKHPFVFISENFYYFGTNAIEIPTTYQDLIWTRQGCKSKFPSELVNEFLKWLAVNYETGTYGEPYDKSYRINKSFIGIDEL